MDARTTLNVRATFIELLQEAYTADTKVHLITDDGGLAREEGIIKSIATDSESPFIELEEGIAIPIQTIVAVNGIFLPEYAEC